MRDSKIVEEPGTGPKPETTKPKLAKAEMGTDKSENGPLRIQGREKVSRTSPSEKGRTITGSIGTGGALVAGDGAI
jgi:hypothetical protein